MVDIETLKYVNRPTTFEGCQEALQRLRKLERVEEKGPCPWPTQEERDLAKQ